MSLSKVSAGVDLGGTWVRVSVVNGSGRSIHSWKAPACTLHQLPGVLKKRFQRWRLTPDSLAVASRGVWSSKERADLKYALQGLAPRLTVLSDVEAAWLAAFGKGSGIVVISGTGSIAYGRNRKGHAARAGGLGPDIGDEGSGYWMGREWLNRRALRTRPRLTVRSTAALSPRVLTQARMLNPIAQAIASEAQHHLAHLVMNVAQKLGQSSLWNVGTAGSVLGNPWFRRGFLKILHLAGHPAGIHFRLVHPKKETAQAIAYAHITR